MWCSNVQLDSGCNTTGLPRSTGSIQLGTLISRVYSLWICLKMCRACTMNSASSYRQKRKIAQCFMTEPIVRRGHHHQRGAICIPVDLRRHPRPMRPLLPPSGYPPRLRPRHRLAHRPGCKQTTYQAHDYSEYIINPHTSMAIGVAGNAF